MGKPSSIQLELTEAGVHVKGLSVAEGSELRGRRLGRQRLLLDVHSKQQTTSGDQAGFGVLSHASFVALLHGFAIHQFSGMLSVDLGHSVKRIYLREGELVFAASNLIDDRLGEVLYREGKITVEQLTEAAVQVNRTTKFGKVLLDSGVFTSSELWDALKLQVATIFRSCFLADDIYVQVEPGENLAPTSIAMNQPIIELIDQAEAYASMLKQFQLRINKDTTFTKVDAVSDRLKVMPGTYIGDIVALVSQYPDIRSFLDHSKLVEINSLAALFDLVHLRVLRIEGYDAGLRGIDSRQDLKPVKSLLDAYHMILDGARKAFEAHRTPFPVTDIEVFLEQQLNYRLSPFFVLEDGKLAAEAVISLYTKARASQRQNKSVTSLLHGLILFLLQLIGDKLPEGKGWELKRHFQNMVT